MRDEKAEPFFLTSILDKDFETVFSYFIMNRVTILRNDITAQNASNTIDTIMNATTISGS